MSKPIRNLRDFLELLHAQRQLAVISAPVDPDQEIPEIHRRVIAEGGPALLFTNVAGSRFPVATNLFGTPGRVELGFGERALRLIERSAALIPEMMPPSPAKLWDARGLLLEGLHIGLDRHRRGPILENRVAPPRLSALPFTQTWPDDGGAFLTLPLVYTHSPADGRANLGIYRMQRFDDATAGMHWQIGKGGGFHYFEAEQRGEALPVSVFLGGPPALILAAVAPLPEGISEMLLASLILGEKLDVVGNPSGPGELVAEAEFALVGRVPPRERRPEGPFGDHYGYYSLRHDYPVFHCDAVFHRNGAIFPATVVGKPRQEDYFIGEYLQRLLKPLYPFVMPAVADLWTYGETGFHALAAAVVRERYGREAMAAAFRILGEGQLGLTKFLLATDAPIELANFRAVLEHVLARFHPETDLYIFSNLSMDTLDYTGPEVNRGSKGVMLGLGEPWRELPRAWEGDPPAGTRTAEVFCPGCLVLGGPAYKNDDENDRAPGGDSFPDLLARNKRLVDWPLVVLCDDAKRATASVTDFLWTVFTRFEPAADLHSASMEIRRNHVVRRGPVVIDARMKPSYPAEVEVAPAIAHRVDSRWNEYFPR